VRRESKIFKTKQKKSERGGNAAAIGYDKKDVMDLVMYVLLYWWKEDMRGVHRGKKEEGDGSERERVTGTKREVRTYGLGESASLVM
jgi:hypothetical protein